MQRVYRKLYSRQDKLCDVSLVCGLNQLKHQDAATIIKTYDDLIWG